MAAFLPDDGLAAAAIREAALTHRHPAAGETSAAVVVLCRSLVIGMSWDAARGAAAHGRVTEIAESLLHPAAVALGNGGYAPEALMAALHFVESAANVNDALEHAVLFAGPANYCPVLVGAIGGTRWGASRIDPRLLRHAAPSVVRTDIRAVAEALADDCDHEH
jgi:ADP-ribosylglycohydrolase